MGATPIVAVETATGTTGSDGLAVFTFGADIDQNNHEIQVDRLPQGLGIDYTITATRQVTFIAPSIPLSGARIWLKNGVQGVTISTSLPAWDTVANLISDAAIELGIAPNAAPITDPFASTDPNIRQLLAYLKSGGRDLTKRRNWTHLQKEFTFATVNGTAQYALPSDYRSLVPNTGWDRTTTRPLGGPVDGEYYQFVKAVPLVGTFIEYIRIWQGQIWLIPTPTAAETLAFEYNGSFWVKPSGQTSPTSSTPTLASDVVCFDPNLVVARLKLDFRRNKKLDTTEEQDAYDDALYAAELEDSPGRTIYIGGRRDKPPRRVDRWNIPDTGAGS